MKGGGKTRGEQGGDEQGACKKGNEEPKGATRRNVKNKKIWLVQAIEDAQDLVPGCIVTRLRCPECVPEQR